MTKRRYGWKPDPPDDRDLIYQAPLRLVSLPPKVDWRWFQSPIEDQGDIGSCTGQAFAAAMEYLDRRADNKHTDVSRLFIYYNERVIEGTIDEDGGAYIRDGIKALTKWGVCDERLWPYDTKRYATMPPIGAYKDAQKRCIQAYRRILTLYDLKAAIAEGLPVVFGFNVYDSFETHSVAQTGRVPVPKDGELLNGGHAVLAVGYDDSIRCLICKNSWGASWGDGGYFYLPYEFVEKYLASDFWAIYGTGLPCGEEPSNPLPSDTVWYIPIINVVRFIWNLFKT